MQLFSEITMNTENVKEVDFSYLEDESNPREQLYLIQGRLTQVEPSSPSKFSSSCGFLL